jgi:hypothetical protein
MDLANDHDMLKLYHGSPDTVHGKLAPCTEIILFHETQKAAFSGGFS